MVAALSKIPIGALFICAVCVWTGHLCVPQLTNYTSYINCYISVGCSCCYFVLILNWGSWVLESSVSQWKFVSRHGWFIYRWNLGITGWQWLCVQQGQLIHINLAWEFVTYLILKGIDQFFLCYAVLHSPIVFFSPPLCFPFQNSVVKGYLTFDF